MEFRSQIEAAPGHGLAFVRRITPENHRARDRVATHDYAAVVLLGEGEADVESPAADPTGDPSGEPALWRLRSGDALVLPGGRAHRFREATQPKGWAVGFCAACLRAGGGPAIGEALRPFEAVRRGSSPVVTLSEARRPFARMLVEELTGETRRPSEEDRRAGDDVARAARRSPLAARSLLTLLLVEISRASGPGPELPDRESLAEPVAQALSYIEEHGLEPISLKDVAEAVGRSPAHLTTTVRKATGRPVGEWITSVRMAEAQRRLLRTGQLVEEIARAVGYADATHFIRLFRRSCGTTPGAWRDEHRE